MYITKELHNRRLNKSTIKTKRHSHENQDNNHSTRHTEKRRHTTLVSSRTPEAEIAKARSEWKVSISRVSPSLKKKKQNKTKQKKHNKHRHNQTNNKQ